MPPASSPLRPALPVQAFQNDLLAWYRVHQRPLPWRENPSLYKTVVSEFMLQQTQVKTVLPYFARWLQALPNFATLAVADEAAVLKLWEGLGYYSRARNLHRLARAIVARTTPPRTPDEWRELPGIGPYTAAAITSIALGQPAACVDGNVVRILARLTADRTPYRDSASAARAFTPLAQRLLSLENPGDHNQAMMELGATVCLRQSPLCTLCPVRLHCAAARHGEPEAFPNLAPKVIEQRAVARLWCERNDHLLLQRADASAKRLAELHELPTSGALGLTDSDLAALPVIAVRKRAITRYAITETIYRLPPPAASAHTSLHWIPLNQLDRITLSGPHRRWITEILAQHAPANA